MVNEFEYGKLVAQVESLDKKVDAMESDIKKLLAMAERSKGSLWALMGVASVGGGFITYLADLFIKK
jgi:hypothetical protein